ncbi:hypothetical protein P2N38_22200 [Escherichia coli]
MGSCAAPSAKGDDKFITTDYLQQCRWTWFFKNYDDLPHIYRSRWRYQRRFILKRLWKRLFNR